MFRVSEYCFQHACSNTAWAELMKPLWRAPDAFLNSSFSFLQRQFDCICFRQSHFEGGKLVSAALTWVLVQADNAFDMAVMKAFSTILADYCLYIARAEAHVAYLLWQICRTRKCRFVSWPVVVINLINGQELMSHKSFHNARLDLKHIWEAEEPNSLMTYTISHCHR